MNVYLNEAATCHCSPVMVDQSPATTYMSGDNSDHIEPKIEPKRGNATSQNGDNERLYLNGLKNVVLELLRSLCICIVRVKINNEELFFNAFLLENSYYFIYG